MPIRFLKKYVLWNNFQHLLQNYYKRYIIVTCTYLHSLGMMHLLNCIDCTLFRRVCDKGTTCNEIEFHFTLHIYKNKKRMVESCSMFQRFWNCFQSEISRTYIITYSTQKHQTISNDINIALSYYKIVIVSHITNIFTILFFSTTPM